VAVTCIICVFINSNFVFFSSLKFSGGGGGGGSSSS